MESILPKLVIFDWDGTLIDSTLHIIFCVQTASKKLHLPEPSVADIRKVIGLSLEVAVQRLFPDIGMMRQTEVFREFRRAYFEQQPGVALYPQVKEVLTHLTSQGKTLAIATGKSRQGLTHDLEKTKIKHFFAATRCGDETFSKPHPAMVLELLSELNVEPEEALVIGDSSYDILMAKNANVKSVAALYGTHMREEFEICEPHCFINSIDEIMQL